jgi:hypothetical protein
MGFLAALLIARRRIGLPVAKQRAGRLQEAVTWIDGTTLALSRAFA